jgi:hypothetical protein
VAAGEAESAHRHGRNLLQGGAQDQGPFKWILREENSKVGSDAKFNTVRAREGPITAGCVAWRAGTTTLVLLGS